MKGHLLYREPFLYCTIQSFNQLIFHQLITLLRCLDWRQNEPLVHSAVDVALNNVS